VNWLIVLAAAAVEVVALLLLVPRFGVAGAGWSVLLAYASMFVLMVWREHRVFPVPYPWGRIARIPVVLGLALAVALAIPDHGALPLALRVAVIAAIPVAYLAIGVLRRADLERMRGLVARWRSRAGGPPPADEPLV
jgi:O-antigen/teichoic acid export membrane protein